MNKKIFYQKFIFQILNLFFPEKCFSCNIELHSQSYNTLCEICWNKLEFILDKSCTYCGTLLQYDYWKYNQIQRDNNKILCIRCKTNHKKYFYDKIIAGFGYNDIMRKLIQKFKYKENTIIKNLFIKLIFNKMQIFNYEYNVDYILPVPLHDKKLIKRGYNQSFLLAKEVSKKINIPCISNALIRNRNIISQSNLKGKERLKNVSGAFSINPKYSKKLANKKILLIDDVVTTSATVNECAKILKKKAKIKKVYVFSVART